MPSEICVQVKVTTLWHMLASGEASAWWALSPPPGFLLCKGVLGSRFKVFSLEFRDGHGWKLQRFSCMLA